MADGTIKKYKGCLCVRGNLGTEEHNAGKTDTHAPVAALPTVQLFLVFCLSRSNEDLRASFQDQYTHVY
eukprot:scaffold104111_cov65-Attheya_sp.AAC.2